jgi:type VI secretion system ImpA family protein
MSSPVLLDIPALLLPIPGDDPAGPPVPYDIRARLEEARKEEDPDDYAPDDPMRPPEFRKADWKGTAQLAQETLTRVSKDLLVAARLTEALVRLHGFAGLRDGLRLLRALVEECWDRLNPPIEDGDVEVRAAPFYWLDDPHKGARFPSTLRALPLVFGEQGRYSWNDWDQLQSKKVKGTATAAECEAFDNAIRDNSWEDSRAAAEVVAQSLAGLDQLAQALGKAMGPAAPALTGIRQALDSCKGLLQDILRRCPAPAPETEKADGAVEAGVPAEAAAPAAPAARGRTPATREEAYRQLAEAAALLRKIEPHSPIPYLVQRATELGALPFPQMIRALIRNPDVLSELNRELGIKEPPPEGQEAPEG